MGHTAPTAGGVGQGHDGCRMTNSPGRLEMMFVQSQLGGDEPLTHLQQLDAEESGSGASKLAIVIVDVDVHGYRVSIEARRLIVPCTG